MHTILHAAVNQLASSLDHLSTTLLPDAPELAAAVRERTHHILGAYQLAQLLPEAADVEYERSSCYRRG